MCATPAFTLDGYSDLLARLRELGYALHPASEMWVQGRAVFLRHDVDAHLDGALALADVEEIHDARSTWYVATRLHYNPATASNAAILHELVSRGHEIGLHYLPNQGDLETDLQTLEVVADCDVLSYVMHQPSLGGEDHHLDAGNPHSHNPYYVSDSNMRWTGGRIERLLAGDAPDRVLLNTHHEHWLADGDRLTHIPRIRDRALAHHREYLGELWLDASTG